MTKDAIIREIRKFFGDTSRSQVETRNDLEDIAELAQELADAISEDLDG